MLSLTTLLFIFIWFLFLLSFLFSLFNGGIKNNIFHIFIVFVCFFYFCTTPFHYFQIENWKAGNVDIRDYFNVGLIQIIFFFTFYLLGYLFLSRNELNFSSNKLSTNIIQSGGFAKNRIFLIFTLLFFIIFFNTLSSGINLFDIVLGRHDQPTLGLRGGSYYLQNFADSLITLLIAAYYFRVEKKYFFIIVLFSFTLFLILGFRYRILLSIFGLLLVYVHTSSINFTFFSKMVFLGLFSLYILIFISSNRHALFTQEYDNVVFDPFVFNFENVYNETFGSYVDFAIYKAHDDGLIEIDYGQTMFGIIFVRAIPAKYFSEGKKPYPPPQLLAIDKALKVPRINGQASTAIGSLFLAFYFPGIILGGLFLGFVIASLQRRVNNIDIFRPLYGIAFVLAIFQWLTRGYFPQVIDHLAYFLFPIFLLAKINHYKI